MNSDVCTMEFNQNKSNANSLVAFDNQKAIKVSLSCWKTKLTPYVKRFYCGSSFFSKIIWESYTRAKLSCESRRNQWNSIESIDSNWMPIFWLLFDYIRQSKFCFFRVQWNLIGFDDCLWLNSIKGIKFRGI